MRRMREECEGTSKPRPREIKSRLFGIIVFSCFLYIFLMGSYYSGMDVKTSDMEMTYPYQTLCKFS